MSATFTPTGQRLRDIALSGRFRTGALALLAVGVVSLLGARLGAPTPKGATTEGAPPAEVRLPRTLPLRRDGDPSESVHWTWARGAVVAAAGFALLGWAYAGRRLRSAGGGASSGLPKGPWIAWLARRPTRRLRVLHSIRLTGKASVHVVRWDDGEWLLGCTEGGITVLERRAPSAGPAGASGPYAELVPSSDAEEPHPRKGAAG